MSGPRNRAKAAAVALKKVPRPLVDVLLLKLTRAETRRIEVVAEKSETTVAKWLRNAILADVAADEAHFEEMAQRDAAASAVDREKLRLLLNKNGHGSEPSKETLDLITDQIAVARAEGRAGLELVSRACREVVIAAGVVFDKDGGS